MGTDNSKTSKIMLQISVIVFIAIFVFIVLFWFNIEHLLLQNLATQHWFICTTFALLVLAVGFIIVSFGRYKDVALFNTKISTLINEARKHKSDMFMIMDILPDMMYVVDKTVHVIWANKSLLAFDKNAIGKTPNEIFGFDETDKQNQLILQSFFSKEVEKSVVYYPANTLFSTDAYLEHYCIPIKDLQQEEITSMAILSANITSKIQFYETRERLNSIVKASQDAIFVIDAKQRIVSWNSAAEHIFGYSNQQIIGQSITLLDHLIDFNVLVEIFDINKIIESHSIKHVELVELKTKSLTYIVDFTLYPFFDETGTIIGISTIVRDRTEAVKAKQALELSEMQMRKLALHIDAVREEERKEIAFSIHDDLGYALSAINMDISWLAKNLIDANKDISARINDMQSLVDITIKRVKTLSAKLRPSILDHFGLIAAIEEQAADFQRRTSIRCKVHINPAAEGLNIEERLRTPIFRIFQEAQTNITRYAKASRVDVTINYINGLLAVEVADNGIGIPEEKINSIESFGLLGIREKANSIGGKATITGKKNEGTVVKLEVKL